MITKQQTIADIIAKHPETIEVFWSMQFHCVGCPAAHSETLEEGAMAHGLDVETLLTALNQAISSANPDPSLHPDESPYNKPA